MRTPTVSIVALIFWSCTSLAASYEVPPSDRTTASVPVISDAAMEECVKLYNEAKWLAQELDAAQVNRYDEAAVDAYNEKVSIHGSMTDRFNADCAGKQSESAYRAAQKLNQQ